MRRGISGLGVVLAVLGSIGCGSSSKEEEYRRDANAICAEADKRLDELPRPSSLDKIAKVAKQEVAIRKEVVAELGELAPPMPIKNVSTNVFEDQEAREERAHALEKAAEKKDRKEVRKLQREGKVEFGLEAERAKEAELDACANA